MNRAALPSLILAILAVPAAGKDSLGVYASWAAFRDAEVPRCYAIASPERSENGFASVAIWPRQNIRSQLHLHLSRLPRENTTITLRIDSQRFVLAARGRDVWAKDAKDDAAIIAAIRSASRMSVYARDGSGRRFTDRYALAGSATAIDAAIVGCSEIT